jgi:hypothetical protein
MDSRRCDCPGGERPAGLPAQDSDIRAVLKIRDALINQTLPGYGLQAKSLLSAMPYKCTKESHNV